MYNDGNLIYKAYISIGRNNFNTEYIISLIKLCRNLENQETKTPDIKNKNIQMLIGTLPKTQGIEIK